VAETERVIGEMLRVGRRGIVSFPNFAYRELREMLYRQGRSPKTAGIYSSEWYNTQNRRFPSIIDFRDFCQTKGIAVETEIYLDTESDTRIDPAGDPNLNADVAIFVIRRQGPP
jgi:homoserine O-acetyltransferase